MAVVGAGVAGCAAALRLAELGVEVDLFEAVAQPQPIGAGLLLQPSGQRVLARMGLLDGALAHGAKVQRLFGDTPQGRTVLSMSYARHAPDAYGLGLQRGALMGLLWQRVRAAQGLHWRCGEAVQDFSQDVRGVQLRGEAGWPLGRARYAALILANGSFSGLRERLSPALRPRARVFPWGAVWTVLPVPAGFPALELRQRFRSARQMLGLMPVGRNFGEAADTPPGMNLFWSLPLERVEAWSRAGAAELAALKREIVELLPLSAPLLEGLRDPVQLRQARYADVSLRRWHDGRVLAIGDCGHGMSPQLGQGANMALVDAHVLAAEVVAGGERPDWEACFARYSQRRRAHLRFYTQASRGLTPLFQSHLRLGPWLRDTVFGWGRHIPFIDRQSVATLTGLKTGWLYGQLDL